MALEWTPETPWVKSNKKTLLHWPSYVCRNPQCKNYGRSHPNCRCGSPGTKGEMSSGNVGGYSLARGGEIHFCMSGQEHSPGCKHYADGGQIELNNEIHLNPELAIDHSIVSHGLLHLLTKTGHTKSEDPNRISEDHLGHCSSGRSIIEKHSKNIFDKSHKVDLDNSDVDSLLDHIESINKNHGDMLNIGGDLGSVLPDHGGALSYKAAMAINHLNAIKPKAQQTNPMSEITPPTALQQNRYKRQARLVQNPATIYNEIKDGTIHPDDLQTLQAVYPKLLERMKLKATGALIDAKTEGNDVPRKQKRSLGSFLGQPLNYTQTPMAMQEIIAANGTNQSQQQPQRGAKGVTAQTQKTIQRADSMYETPLQERQIDKKQ